MIDISIIIVSWNTRDILRDCLHSILRHSKDLGIETFVVDNNSFDGTCMMIQKEFPIIKLIENSDNLGFAKANNQAIKLATGRYILALNPDTILSESTLENMVAFMDSHPNAGAGSCKILDEKGEIFRFRTEPLSLRDELFRDTVLARLLPFARRKRAFVDYSMTQRVKRVSGTCLIIRRETMEQIGMFDERYFLYVEDDDLCRRINEISDVYIIGDAEITHLGGKSSDQVRDEAWLLGTRARYLYHQKYSGFIMTFLVRFVSLVSSVISYIKWKILSLLGTNEEKVAYKLDFYRASTKAILGINTS